ncbi:MAG: helix-turn-helix transcriptional regulator [Coriobacteriia bacterium]|nr:helix-turn-helix transcriptional regulator [Coriobacteriia bacterium]
MAVMLTALAILFLCLLGATYHRPSRGFVTAGAVLYLLGYIGSQSILWFPNLSGSLLAVSGLLLGVGLSLLIMTWLWHLRLRNIRLTFALLLIALCLTAALNMALHWVPWQIESGVRLALACVGSLGALHATRSPRYVQEAIAADNGTNSKWWEIFGHLNLPFAKDSDDFTPPYARVLFFVVTPLVVLLLFVVNRGVDSGATTLLGGLYTPEMIAGLLCAPSAAILLLVYSDQGLVSTICRLYLPMLALALFAIVPFATSDAKMLIMHIGIDVFCSIYALLLSAMLLAVANRMRSLLLPSAALLLIALSLVALLAFRGTEAGFLGSYRPQVGIALFACAVGLLLLTPGSRIWRMLIEGAADESEKIAPSLQARCAVLAKAYHLTEREAEIIPLLGRGYGASHVAEILVVAESTIRSHRGNIYRKLNINSREALLDLLDSPAIDSDPDNG